MFSMNIWLKSFEIWNDSYFVDVNHFLLNSNFENHTDSENTLITKVLNELTTTGIEKI